MDLSHYIDEAIGLLTMFTLLVGVYYKVLRPITEWRMAVDTRLDTLEKDISKGLERVAEKVDGFVSDDSRCLHRMERQVRDIDGKLDDLSAKVHQLIGRLHSGTN